MRCARAVGQGRRANRLRRADRAAQYRSGNARDRYRAARTNGLTNDEIKELILQSAIYCGVPDANTAFRIAQRVLTEIDELDGEGDA